jgi:hypothetical protein
MRVGAIGGVLGYTADELRIFCDDLVGGLRLGG